MHVHPSASVPHTRVVCVFLSLAIHILIMCVCKHWGHNTWTNTPEQTACTIWSDCCNLIRDNRTCTIKLSTHHALYTRLLVCAIRVSGFWWVKSPTKTVLDVYTLWCACFEAHWIPGKREIDELPDEDHQKKQLAERDWVFCYQLSFDIRCQLVHTCSTGCCD